MYISLLRSCFVFLSLLLLTANAGAGILVPAPPQMAAKAWILMDAKTGTVIDEGNADEQLPPASLTKMMTSYIVSKEIESGRINEEDEALVSENAWRTGGWASGSSVMSLAPKAKVKVIDLLRGVIIQSGNDASIVLAEHLAGSESAFADIMNQQAQLLGMTHTFYVNSTGLPAEGHTTTARDLAILARALINDYPGHYSIYSEKYFEYNGIKQPNRNLLLWRDSSVDGIKTGHTSEAGYCLVSSAVRDGMRLIAVVLGARSEEVRARESQKLLSYGFRYYQTDKIYAAGDIVQQGVRVWYGKTDTVDLMVPEDIHLVIERGSRDQLVAEANFDSELKAPLEKGQQLGSLSVKYQDKLLLETPIVAASDVPEAGIFSRLWDWLVLLITGLFD